MTAPRLHPGKLCGPPEPSNVRCQKNQCHASNFLGIQFAIEKTKRNKNQSFCFTWLSHSSLTFDSRVAVLWIIARQTGLLCSKVKCSFVTGKSSRPLLVVTCIKHLGRVLVAPLLGVRTLALFSSSTELEEESSWLWILGIFDQKHAPRHTANNSSHILFSNRNST